MKELKRKAEKADVLFCVGVFCLSLLGLLFIYCASSYGASRDYKDAFYYVKKQAVALVPGTIAFLVISKWDVKKLKGKTWILLIASYVLLALIFTPLGVEFYGAKRWINLGLFTIQPSEIAKFGLVIFLADLMAKRPIANLKWFICALAAGGVCALLIMLEPNMSITMCVCFSIAILLFGGGAKVSYFLALILPAALGVAALILAEPYRMQRIIAFIDPWSNPKGEGYQLIQSYYALGSGGLFGVGLFNSRQKLLFLPFAESDFILSVIGEELGLCGVIGLLLIYLFVIYRGLRICFFAQDRFSAYLVLGVITVLTVQTALNVAVVSGSIPPTGLPLPFISAGGSSLVAYMAAMGLVASVSRNCARKGVRCRT